MDYKKSTRRQTYEDELYEHDDYHIDYQDGVKEPFHLSESMSSPNFDKYCKNLKHMFGREEPVTKFK